MSIDDDIPMAEEGDLPPIAVSGEVSPDDGPAGPPGEKPLGTLALPDAWASWAWELTRRRLVADPTLRAAGIAVESFQGVGSLRDLDACRLPVLRFWPGLGPTREFDEGRTITPLVVGVECGLATLNPYDVFNLQCHLIRILLGSDQDASDFRQSLIERANADTGRWQFTQALGQPQKWAGKDKLFRLTGAMQLPVLTPLSPL